MIRQRLFSILIIFGLISSGCASTPLRKPGLNNRKAYVDAHMDLTQSIREAILHTRVIEGMTYEDVRAGWGEPNEIGTAADSKFLSEGEVVWEYNRLFLVPIFVHFYKGIVSQVNDDYK